MQEIVLQGVSGKMHGLTARGYNGFMPKPQRPSRVNLKVTKQVKELASLIAVAMSNEEARWTETDVFEQGVLHLAQRADVRKALTAAKPADTAPKDSE